jgi:elongation factor G
LPPSCLLVDEDPSLTVRTDDETGQNLLSGLGELHLEVAVERMRQHTGLAVTVGRPQVAYRMKGSSMTTRAMPFR